MTEERLDLQGPLAETLPLLEEVACSDEINRDRINHVLLRYNNYWAADIALFRFEGDELVWYLAREPNILFENLEEATRQFQEGEFEPTREDIEKVVDGSLRTVIPQSLNLHKIDDENVYFRIVTAHLGRDIDPKLSPLVERIYGSMDEQDGERFTDFEKIMKIIYRNKHKPPTHPTDIGAVRSNIWATAIRIPNPEYVREQGTVVRACGMYSLDGGFRFITTKDIDYPLPEDKGPIVYTRGVAKDQSLVSKCGICGETSLKR